MGIRYWIIAPGLIFLAVSSLESFQMKKEHISDQRAPNVSQSALN